LSFEYSSFHSSLNGSYVVHHQIAVKGQIE
jgi:hypothetical protein